MINIDDLAQIKEREKESGPLMSLPPTYYRDLTEHLKALDAGADAGDYQAADEAKGIRILLGEIHQVRINKIAIFAMADAERETPRQAFAGWLDSERALYDDLRQAFRLERAPLERALAGAR